MNGRSTINLEKIGFSNLPIKVSAPQAITKILAESGYKEIEVWLESEEVFCIGRAKNLG